ncbi:MAG: caspase family protein, partial [Desulfobacterales bacterium]
MWALLIWLAGGISMPVRAENHALLIGIGKYRQRTLEGPPYDVAALSRMLTTEYDFQKKNIRTLVDEEAVRSRILFEIERLTQRTRPGDRIFIYFSGHGTSRRDEMLALPLPYTTGALVPADFDADPAQPVAKLLSQLIIGKRDLRPVLEQLDQDRQVLMVFDTCFSGNTVRGNGKTSNPDMSRYLPLRSRSVFTAEQEIGGFDENLNPDDPYPYQNIFYISAASENEVAKDIQKNNLSLYPTIDGNPHGVLTDALLRVLAGRRPVDADNDGQWSQIELYAAVKKEVQRRFPQSPQALPKAGESAERLYARTFFVRKSDGMAAPAGASSGRTPERQDASYQPGYSSSHALLVGINEYRRWPRLEYAADDAGEMAARLKTQGFQIYLLTNEQATLKNMLAALETIRKSVDENSRVVLYFAGHGQTEDKMMRSRSIQILTAGSRSEQAIEAAGHGLFTDQLLAALAGAADINSDGYITATEIYATLRPAITRKSYSRQTPQFGYIEGNGDIIFMNTRPEIEPAAVVIDTAISGIDVWAGTSEIGRRLPAGRHRLTTAAGPTTLMVKKGGRTLYRTHVLLSADREFPIQIGAAAAASQHREAFAALTIADHGIDNYSNSMACDLDGDGREEVVTASDSQLIAFRFDGTVVWEKKFHFPISLNLIGDWNSQPAIGLSGLDGDKLQLLVLDRWGEPIWRHARNLTRFHNGKPDGGGRIAALADIDQDG